MVTTAEARQGLIALGELSKRDIDRLFKSMIRRNFSAEEMRDSLVEVIPGLAETYQLLAIDLASEWYSTARAEAGVGASFRVVEAEPITSSDYWAPLIVHSMSSMFQPEPDPEPAAELLSGGLHKRTAQANRLTVMETAIADSQSKGWARYGRGESCEFCRMLINKGAVYSSSTVSFSSHTNCNCIASPVWGNEQRNVDKYVKSTRNRSADDRQRVREWLKDNKDVG